MLVLEFKVQAKQPKQYQAIDEAIRIGQFIQNKCLRLWMDVGKNLWTDHKGKTYEKGLTKFALVGITSEKARFFKIINKDDIEEEATFAYKLHSQARGLASERAWCAIKRFYDNCKKKIAGKKGYPKFKKNARSIEYQAHKEGGWFLSGNRKFITFTDGCHIGKLRLMGDFRVLFHYPCSSFKRCRLLKQADGYYIQIVVDADRELEHEKTGSIVGIDVGLHSITCSDETIIEQPTFYRKGIKKLRRLQRIVSRRTKGSCNRRKAVVKLKRFHLTIQRRRKDFLVKTARALSLSNDKVFLEDLQISKMAQSKERVHLNQRLLDVGSYFFRTKLQYYATIGGAEVILVKPENTRIQCSNCGALDEKMRTQKMYLCSQCGYMAYTGLNSAINIVRLGMNISTFRGY